MHRRRAATPLAFVQRVAVVTDCGHIRTARKQSRETTVQQAVHAETPLACLMTFERLTVTKRDVPGGAAVASVSASIVHHFPDCPLAWIEISESESDNASEGVVWRER